jgi:NEDD8-activating enzyme E1 regulatory subunit
MSFKPPLGRCKSLLLPRSFDPLADIGYISARAPTADLPNVAAFLGGLVAQEAIKMITKQYVPVNGYCVVDLIDTWTGVVA